MPMQLTARYFIWKTRRNSQYYCIMILTWQL